MIKNYRNYYVVFAFLYLLLIYCNTFQVPFLFDDKQNILERADLRLTRITPDAIIDTFFLQKGENESLYRPISCLSFALNYYVGGYRVSGYHLVNLLIHCFTTFFLYKTLLLLLELGKIPLNTNEKVFVAGLSAILWAAHPIQTQAVTYIVQRMAALAAMFYIIGIWSYLKFRSSIVQFDRNRGVKWLIIALFSFTAGVLSKENAGIFPIAILLLELFFFNGFEKIWAKPIQYICFAAALLVIPVLVGYFFFNIDGFGKLFSSYQVRPFTITERILTQPRVFFHYIYQLIYPIPTHFSLVHYVPLSESLISPVTTLLSIAGIIIGIIIAFMMGKKYPLIAFPVVFYFSHHIVESSILPLEMVYEHRNYLPAFFFFLPVSLGLAKALSFYKNQSKLIWISLVIFTTSLVFFLGLSSHTRNKDWQSVQSFWAKEISAAPELVRPFLGMGWQYTTRNSKNLDLAYFYFNAGVNKKEYFIKFERADLLLNIAKLHLERHEYGKAISAAQKGLGIYNEKVAEFPDLEKNRSVKEKISLIYKTLADIYAYIDVKVSLEYIEKAIELIDSAHLLNEKAVYLIKSGKHEDAFPVIQDAFKKSSQNRDTLFIAAHLFTKAGNYAKGHWYYQQYFKEEGDSSQGFQPIYLFMAENRYLANDNDRGDKYLHNLVQSGSLNQIYSLITKIKNNHPKMLPFIEETLLLMKLNDILNEYIGTTNKEKKSV